MYCLLMHSIKLRSFNYHFRFFTFFCQIYNFIFNKSVFNFVTSEQSKIHCMLLRAEEYGIKPLKKPFRTVRIHDL